MLKKIIHNTTFTRNVALPGIIVLVLLFYRGYNVQDIVKGLSPDNHFGFEECIYLLLFGHLPTLEERDEFVRILAGYRSLPPNFVRDVIMKKPSKNMMNSLARSVLTLYSYDDDPDSLFFDFIAPCFLACPLAGHLAAFEQMQRRGFTYMAEPIKLILVHHIGNAVPVNR